MKKWKNNKIAKVLGRLVGDRAGGVMMEYVILAVLIAAAAVVAVMYFGRGIVTNLSTSTHAMSGESGKASATSKRAKAQAGAAEADNENYRKEHADR